MSSTSPKSEQDSAQNQENESNKGSQENSSQDDNGWDGVERRSADRPWSDENKNDGGEEQILSQEERDALTGDVEELSDASGVISYDFYSPAHINKSSLPALAIINEKIVDSMKEKLSKLLQREIDITANEIDISRYGEFINSLPNLIDVNLINVSKIDAQTLICMDGALIEIVMDAYFGGEGKLTDATDKQILTQSELNLSSKLLEMFLASSRLAWEKSEKLDFQFIQRESQPKLINLIGESELVVVCLFKVKLDEEASYIRIAYPYKALEPIKQSLRNIVSEQSEENNVQWKNEFINSLKAVPIELNTILVEFELTVDQVIKLKPGDVVPFSMPDCVTVYSSATPIFKGKVGTVSGAVAVSIDTWINKYNS